MFKSNKAFGAILVALIALSLAGCGDGDTANNEASSGCTPKWKFDTVKAGTLTVAAPEQPPYFMTVDGKASGLDGDILTKFAEDACLKTDYKTVASAAAIESAITRRVDVVAGGWDASDDRAKQVGQTDGTYADVPAIDSAEGLSTMAELKGKSVGTITGYYWVPDMQNYLGKDSVKLYPNSTNVLKDLVAGRIDAAVLSTVEAGYVIAQNSEFASIKNQIIEPDPEVPFTDAKYYSNFPHVKGNEALTQALNEEIAAWKASADFANLLKKYGVPVEVGKVG